MSNEFGFTNDPNELNLAVAFREAAIKDGWNIKPTYKTESQDRHASLEKEGFKCSVVARIHDKGKWKYEAQVSMWGPDGLCILTPKNYDWEKIKAGPRRCDNCLKEDVDTFRYSFAGRCCEECLPAMQKKHEYPGWCR